MNSMLKDFCMTHMHSMDETFFYLQVQLIFLWLQYKIDGFYTKIDRIKDVVPSCVFYCTL